MLLTVEILMEGQKRPPVGSPVRVQVRDTSLADAPSVTVKETLGAARGQHGPWLETALIDLDRLPRGSTIWAHVDVDNNGRVTPGDCVITASYPAPVGEDTQMQVEVRLV